MPVHSNSMILQYIIKKYSTSYIIALNDFLYQFIYLAAANTSATQQKKYDCFFQYSKVMAQQNKTSNKTIQTPFEAHILNMQTTSSNHAMPGRFELPFARVETHGTGRSLQTCIAGVCKLCRLSVIRIPTSYNSRNQCLLKRCRNILIAAMSMTRV